MIFTKEITLAAGQTEATATSTKLKMSKGVIHEFNAVFPSGCVQLVNLKIYQGGHQLFPSTEGMVFSGNNEVIDFKTFHELGSEENYLDIVAWNTDDTYPHTITVRFGVLPKYVLLPSYAVQGIIGSLKALFMQKR